MIATIDNHMPHLFIAIALAFTFWLAATVGFQEGFRYGQDHAPVRLVPATEYAQFCFKGTRWDI